MTVRATADDGGLPLAEWKRIDSLCSQFETAWANGERPDPAAFLAGIDGPGARSSFSRAAGDRPGIAPHGGRAARSAGIPRAIPGSSRRHQRDLCVAGRERPHARIGGGNRFAPRSSLRRQRHEIRRGRRWSAAG